MASIYFFSSHPEQHLNTCLVVLTWLVCFWGGMLHHMMPRGKVMSYRCCNGDPRSLSESPHFTHPPPLLHGYETGTGFFVWFFFHSSFGNQTSADEDVCWVAVPEGISSRMQMEVAKSQRGHSCGEGGVAGGGTSHTWGTAGLATG